MMVFIAAMILVFPFILISSILFKEKQAQDIIFLFLKLWAWIFSILCFFPVRTRGYKHKNQDKAYIYVCNHNSYLDAITVVIDRKNKESRAHSVEELKIDLARGQSILIFPEGKMNKTEANLAEFYDGAFRLAIETQTDIAPMVILNARNLLPRANPLSVKPGLITCIFDEPVYVAGLQAEDLEDLKAKVRKRMENLMKSSV